MGNNAYETFYHFTEQKDAASLFSQGLLPRIGPRSACTGHGTPCCYLCKEDSLAHWYLTLPLENPYLIKLKLPPSFVKEHITKGHRYGRHAPYTEYICSHAILPQRLNEPCPLPKIKPAAYQGLVSDALLDLSMSVVGITRFFGQYGHMDAEKQKQAEKDLETYYVYGWEQTARYLDKLCQHGAFCHIDIDGLGRLLKEEGEKGEYTLCDTYGTTGQKLFEQLPKFTGPLQQVRERLSQCVLQYFPWAGNLSTGGYDA